MWEEVLLHNKARCPDCPDRQKCRGRQSAETNQVPMTTRYESNPIAPIARTHVLLLASRYFTAPISLAHCMPIE
jgi:hypothetical protein